MTVTDAAHAHATAVILHVDDDTDDVFLTARAFKKSGIGAKIATASNGEEAAAYLLGSGQFADRSEYPLPAVVLLDWNMPLMSGGEFLRWLRTERDVTRLPVIVLTSSTNEADMRQAYRLGANGFIVKPRSTDDMSAMAKAFAEYWLKWNNRGRDDLFAAS
jgi:CheY-like chemotaxis protein